MLVMAWFRKYPKELKKSLTPDEAWLNWRAGIVSDRRTTQVRGQPPVAELSAHRYAPRSR